MMDFLMWHGDKIALGLAIAGVIYQLIAIWTFKIKKDKFN